METNKLDLLCVNTIRTLVADAVQHAGSGHPGMPMGMAPAAYVLWQQYLRHNPKDPAWPDRDRFFLSAGHGSMLLYSMLHLTGYDITLDDIRQFRQWGSRTPGHPECRITPGVEATTGPLGQGQADAVGAAIAERSLANYFNRPGYPIVDHYTYSILSDGDMMEGISGEAASLAGFLKLSKLIFFYDSNRVSLDGPTSQTFATEDVAKRYEACGWHVQHVADGDTDLPAIDAAIAQARAETERPSLIIIDTTIAYGSPHKQGTYLAHGEPLGEEEVALTKANLGWDPSKTFYVPEEALAHFRTALETGRTFQQEWEEDFRRYSKEYPDLAEEWQRRMSGKLPDGWDSDLPVWKAGEKIATRVASGSVINSFAPHVPELIGGDADLSTSTKTFIEGAGDFEGAEGSGRNIRYGVREHAMCGIANGIACHGGMRPFVSTFAIFSDYMRPAIRLCALSKAPVIFVFTHDSIGLGQDGPTHQPIEHLMSFRAMPDISVVRPCDANETAEAWRFAMRHTEGPVILMLTRQKLPVLDRTKVAEASGLERGAYVLLDPQEEPRAIIIGTGSEVAVGLAAQELLSKRGIAARVVSMPCWEAFERQSQAYQESVLPPAITARVSVEAGATLGWRRWVGGSGAIIGIDRFGASAPGEINMEKFGFTPERVARTVEELLEVPVGA